MIGQRMKRTLVGLAAFLALAAAVEVGMYNWRISLALEVESLREHAQELRREWEDLSSQRAVLCAPSRLRVMGDSLGLQPLPLDQVSIVSISGPDPGQSDDAPSLADSIAGDGNIAAAD
jgi:hypothetical protein